MKIECNEEISSLFSERLKKYRKELNLKASEMADKLQISSSYYNIIENEKRPPSKSIVEKLIIISRIPEVYWVTNIKYSDSIDLKKIKEIIDLIIETNTISNINEIFDENHNPKNLLGKLLIANLKSSIAAILENNRE